MGQPLAYFEITSSENAERLQSFYADMFGWNVNQLPDMGGYALVDTQSGQGSVVGGIGPAMGEPGVRVYFHAPDLDAALKRAEELGGSKVMEPTELPGFGNIAVFADPDGNAIGLWDQRSA
ncbi:VOC family protein [Streptomyces sp. B8F3]|uniref:VOC family protein n=1 Tax=unclassified Streptomyces TaxID=2593676 RepID=UPI00325ED3FB